MEASSSRTVEITVLSAENLRLDKKSVKKNLFVIVQTDLFNCHTTRTDTLGGAYPSWNEKIVIDLPMHGHYISLEVHSKSSSVNISIGFAKIPVFDFIGGYVPESYLHFLSYRLRDAKWEKNGIINVSVRVKTLGYKKSSSNTRLKVTGYTSFSSQASNVKVQGYGSCSWQVTRLNVQGYPSYSSPVTGPNVQGYASYSSQSQACLGVSVGGVVTGKVLKLDPAHDPVKRVGCR